MSTMKPPERPGRISQHDRREAAQSRILDATVSLLVEQGYAATTTLEVQRQSGIARGVLLHYYGSRRELIGAAARHLYATRIAEVHAQIAARSAYVESRDDWASLLWQVVSGPFGRACLELLGAARHDEDMRAYLIPLEREFGRANVELCAVLLGDDCAAHPRFREFCLVLINSMFGAAAESVDPGSTEEKRLLAAWREMPQMYFGTGSFVQ